MAGDKRQFFCKECKKMMNENQFYGSNNLEKYPEGKLDICKGCLTRHVDNWEYDTYEWILKEIDVPYVPKEWFSLMEKYGQNPEKMTGLTIIGRYLSKMKLKQYKDYRFKDSEFLQEVADAELSQAMKQQGYDAAEIAEVIQKSKVAPVDLPRPSTPSVETGIGTNPWDNDEDDDIDLSEEDKTYLKLKWGKMYRPDEWVRLEQFYEDMMASYDIQGAGHEDTLKLICKTSLKANQLVDLGDIDGYQKMSKVYDQLMKSGRFTAQQNKQEEGEFVDAIGQLVEICEKEGFIPRYYVDEPKDKVDATIADLKGYTKQLVYDELNLGNLIEQSMRAMMEEENKEELEDGDDADLENEILNLDNPKELETKDYQEYSEFLDDELTKDQETILKLIDGDV